MADSPDHCLIRSSINTFLITDDICQVPYAQYHPFFPLHSVLQMCNSILSVSAFFVISSKIKTTHTKGLLPFVSCTAFGQAFEGEVSVCDAPGFKPVVAPPKFLMGRQLLQ